MTKRPRPLILAEAANPEWVSVPLVGWSLARALQRETDGHIVTQIRNRDAFLRAGLREGRDFTAIDSEAVAKVMWRVGETIRMGQGKGWTTVTALNSIDYPYFERLVWQQFGSAICAGEFDVVHRVTPLSPTVASPIAVKCEAAGVPFILGPLNGGIPWPKGFDSERRREREWLSYIRGAYRLLPGRRQTLKSATAIITGSCYTRSEIPQEYQHKCIYIPENSIDVERFSLLPKADVSTPLRACFIGRLVPYKGADMLLKAAADALRDGTLNLDIIGDGPMMEELQTFVARESLENAVSFHGWVNHHEVQAIAQRADIFTFPSVREFGGGVVLEAMMLGVVPIIVDYGGPGEHVTEGTGIKIPIDNRSNIVANLKTELHQLIEAPDKLPELSRAARERILDKYTWSRKAEQICDVYHWALQRTTEKPNPFFL